MSFLNLFKKKSGKKKEAVKKSQPVEPRQPKPQVSVQKSKRISGLAYLALIKPQVTEKATILTEKNQYVFEVFPKANKNQIKQAVEDVYGVDVVSVRVINVSRKKKRLGRISGWRKGYKKAVVKLAAGQKIEVLPR
jgi:large subunit ribosomal protein L23